MTPTGREVAERYAKFQHPHYSGGTLTHGRTRKRPVESFVLVLLIVAGTLAFVAGAFLLAAALLLLTT